MSWACSCQICSPGSSKVSEDRRKITNAYGCECGRGLFADLAAETGFGFRLTPGRDSAQGHSYNIKRRKTTVSVEGECIQPSEVLIPSMCVFRWPASRAQVCHAARSARDRARAVARVQIMLAAFARWNHSLQGLENQYCYCPGRASMDSSWGLLIINGTRGSKRSSGLDRINMYVCCPRYGILYL